MTPLDQACSMLMSAQAVAQRLNAVEREAWQTGRTEVLMPMFFGHRYAADQCAEHARAMLASMPAANDCVSPLESA